MMVKEEGLIKLTRGVPATEALPIEGIRVCCERALHDYGTVLLQYHSSMGFLPLREILAAEVGVKPDQVIVSNGSIQLLDFLAEALLSPGDVVLVERPTYDRTITAFRQAGMKVVGIPLKDDGIEIESLEEAIKQYRPRLLYLIPDFNNPTGITTSLRKRETIVALADQHNFTVVEDLPYRRLRYHGKELPTLYGLGKSRVVQMSSFSKTLSPGIRVGWMIAPPELIKRMAKIAEDTYITPSMLSQGVAYEFIRAGKLEPNIERLKRLYAPRLEATLKNLDAYLPGASWSKPEGGFFVGLTLPMGVNAPDVAQVAKKENLLLSNGAKFFPDDNGRRFVRFPFCALSEREIAQAVQRLARAVKTVEQQ